MYEVFIYNFVRIFYFFVMNKLIKKCCDLNEIKPVTSVSWSCILFSRKYQVFSEFSLIFRSLFLLSFVVGCKVESPFTVLISGWNFLTNTNMIIWQLFLLRERNVKLFFSWFYIIDELGAFFFSILKFATSNYFINFLYCFGVIRRNLWTVFVCFWFVSKRNW